MSQPPARTAALASASNLRSRAMRHSTTGSMSWQQKVIQYDREGPGILGYYLDTVALLASLCPLVPAEQGRDGKWVRSDDPVLNVLAQGYRSPLFEQAELVAMQVRAREGVGEAWIIHSEDVGWHVVTVPNVIPGAGHDRSVQWTDVYGVQRKTEAHRVHKSWIPDPWEPYLPTSPVRRALPNLRRIHSAVRSQIRAADSRMTMNGIVSFKEAEGGSRPFREDEQGIPEGVDEVIADYLDLAQKAFTDDDSVAANVPFPVVGEKPEFTELGRGIDKMALEMEDKGIEAFARDVNFPAQLLTTGPGSANHWNEWILQEIQHKMGLAPKLNPVAADVTAIYFRPAVSLLKNRVGSWDVDPNRVRLEPDYSFLTSKPDKAAQAIEAYRIGAITREEMVRELGFTEVMPLPAGIDEYEHWQLSTGGKGFPFVEVGADGRIVVPEDPAATPLPPLDAEPMAELPPAAPEDVAALPVVDDPGQVTEGMPEPPAELAPTAALGDPEAPPEVERLLAELVAVDVALETGLDATATAAATAAVLAVARAVIRAYPARDPERARLRALPPEEVWAAAAPEYRAKVDVESVVAEALEPYQPQVEDRFVEAAAAIAAAHDEANGDEDGVLLELLVAAAVLALLAGVTKSVVGWLTVPNGFTRDAAERAGSKRVLRVPPSVIRSAMAVAGGGRSGLDGQLVPGRSGAPIPTTGGPWEGNTGMATGHNSLSAIDLPPGWRIALRWKHGMYRKPKEPFLPHVALDERTFGHVSEVPDGLYPGDHPWCSCGLVPTLERV